MEKRQDSARTVTLYRIHTHHTESTYNTQTIHTPHRSHTIHIDVTYTTQSIRIPPRSHTHTQNLYTPHIFPYNMQNTHTEFIHATQKPCTLYRSHKHIEFTHST